MRWDEILCVKALIHNKRSRHVRTSLPLSEVIDMDERKPQRTDHTADPGHALWDWNPPETVERVKWETKKGPDWRQPERQFGLTRPGEYSTIGDSQLDYPACMQGRLDQKLTRRRAKWSGQMGAVPEGKAWVG